MRETIWNKSKLKKGKNYTEVLDEHGSETMYMDNDETYFYVYILYKSKLPVYVGRTKNIKSRINNHLSIKRDFDSYSIVRECYTDFEANFIEKAFISYFKSINPDLQNKISVRPCGAIIKL